MLPAAVLVAVAGLVASAREASQARSQPNYREVAIDAAKWVRNSRVETLFGITWPADPNDPKTISTALYNGSPVAAPTS
jgi:hypothetical protein